MIKVSGDCASPGSLGMSMGMKGNEAGEGSGELVLRGAAEPTGAVQSGEEEAQGGPCHSLQLPERRL